MCRRASRAESAQNPRGIRSESAGTPVFWDIRAVFGDIWAVLWDIRAVLWDIWAVFWDIWAGVLGHLGNLRNLTSFMCLCQRGGLGHLGRPLKPFVVDIRTALGCQPKHLFVVDVAPFGSLKCGVKHSGKRECLLGLTFARFRVDNQNAAWGLTLRLLELRVLVSVALL